LQPALHQQVTTPSPAKTTGAGAPTPTVAPRRRKPQRRRYILIGIGALILLCIVGAYLIQGLLDGEFVDFSHHARLTEDETTSENLRQNPNYSNPV